ncbi:MAG: TonB family protein [Acidobacteriota bacterium]|nr:MAG: TonB family protein [Acidobacteriota bacterium]
MKTILTAAFTLVFSTVCLAQSAMSVKGGPARLMSAPDAESTVIVEIPSGTIVEPIRSEEGSDWLYVSFREFRGWVLKSRLAESEGGPLKPQADTKIAAERSAVDEYIAAVISKSPKSVRDRGLGELRDQRSEARGDLDGDGDEDVVAAYSLGIGTEPRSTHLAVFENVEGILRLKLDERLAGGTGVRVADIFDGRLQIEIAGEKKEVELVAGRLIPAKPRESGDGSGEDDDELETADDESGNATLAAPSDGAPPPPPPPPPEVPKRISKGVINGSAIELPAPTYPEAARAVGASGTVNVAVVIDHQGVVISAAAVSGHPLLRSAAVSAATLARFRPTLLSGQPVEVSGVIVYNFVPSP